MAFEVTKQEILKQAIALNRLWKQTREQKYRDEEVRLRRIALELEDLANLSSSGVGNLQQVTDEGNSTTNSITVNGITSPYFLLDTTATPTPQQGMLFWDEDRSTVGLQMNGVEARLAQDNFWYVKNQTGSPIPKGTAVMAVGALGASSRILVAPMVADGSVDEQYFLGITAEEILNGEDGFVTNIGKIRGIDTSVYGAQAGQILYCDPANPGGFTITQPQAPNLNIPAAFTVDYKSNGTIAVRALPGYHLSELHDVYINTPSDQDILLYNGTNNRWENTPLASAVPTPTLQTVTDAGNSTTNAISITTADTYKFSMYEDGGNRELHLGVGNGYGGSARFRYIESSTIKAEVYLGNDLIFDKKGTGGTIFRDNAVEKARFANSTGNVLIGTTTDAGYKLDVNGTTKTSGLIFSTGYFSGILWATTNGSINSSGNPNIHKYSNGLLTNAGATGDLYYYTGGLERLRITSSGNVGIGTTTPSYKLDVNGDARATSFIKTGGTASEFLKADGSVDTNTYLTDLSPISVDGDKVSIAADTTATTQTTAVIQATDTNSGIAIVPNGTGAFTLQVPDGTVTGGNARGNYAVDLQMVRTFNGNIASGISSLVFGYDNRASGNYSFAGGNYRNYALGEYSFAFGKQSVANSLGNIAIGQSCITNAENSIAMGRECSATGGQSVSLGFLNTSSSAKSTVSGGASNTASTNTYATVVGGYQNSSTGKYSVSGGYSNVASGQGSVALGDDNTASGIYSSVALGRFNTASGESSISIGKSNQTLSQVSYAFGQLNIVNAINAVAVGSNNNISGSGDSNAVGFNNIITGYASKAISTRANISSNYTTAFGDRAKGYLYGSLVSSNGRISTDGDSQASQLVARKSDTLTTGATTTLSLDGTGTTNLIIPDGNNRVWNVTVETVAVVTVINAAVGIAVGDVYSETTKLTFKKIGGVSSLVGILSQNAVFDGGMGTATMNFSAGASQELAIEFQAPSFGAGDITVRVVSKVSLVEVAY